ncbi:MAG: CapA family protein [Oscillospiraceae bacterium]|nr:CapA family protein [Oscillospiraceae bacterium]
MKLNTIAAMVCSSLLFIGCLTGCQNVQQTVSTAEQSHVETAVTTALVQTTITETTTTEPLPPFDYTICFSGDICIEDNAYTTQYWKSCGEDITQCMDETMIDHMRSADICFINNEFPYSTRGSATVGKDYTYRADPANVKVLPELGVDIVSLANNHAYDYGEDALLDTLDTLQTAGIPYVGAGKDLEEASSIYYYELNGFTVAFLSGTRVEWEELTKGATENEPGVFRTVDPTLLYERVKEADQHADYVVVYMHWGIEGVTYLEEYQLETGNGLIDAGADAVIGDHTHCLQGIDFYQDKPIVYSLGNYWFNGKTMDTMLAELHITGTAEDYDVQLQLVPAVQSNCQVTYIEDPSAQDTFYRNMEAMSYGISIDENGVVTDTD